MWWWTVVALADPGCDAQVAELRATMSRVAEREQQGLFGLEGVGPVLTVAFDEGRASRGSHEGVVLRATGDGFHVGLPSTFDPVPFATDVDALAAGVSNDRNWSFGKKNGVDRLLHYNVALPPDVPWSRVLQAAEAAQQLDVPTVTFLLAHDEDPLDVPPSSIHEAIVDTRGDLKSVVGLIRRHFAPCEGVGRGLGKLAGKFPHHRATVAAELLPSAFTDCGCAVPPADFAEIWVTMQTDALWGVDRTVEQILALDLDPETPWSKAAKKVLRAK